jgi:hypothetical protein
MALRPIVTPSSDPGGFAALASTRVPAGWVRLTCSDPPLDALALMGEDSPHYTAGFGGWEITQRPRQVGMTTWQGTEPLELELGIVLDGLNGHHSQERVLRKLYAVARGDDESPPGVLRVRGIPLAADRWVIDSLELGDAIRRRSDGALIRQALTLTLREYVPPHYLQLRKGALSRAKGKTKLVTVKRGDTPATLARKHRCKWTEIRALNKTAHPPKQPWKANSNLKDGSKVRVPVATTHERKAKGSLRSRKTKGSK